MFTHSECSQWSYGDNTDNRLVMRDISQKKKGPLNRVTRLIASLPHENLILFQRIYTVQVNQPQLDVCH